MHPFANSESSSQMIIMYNMTKLNAAFIRYKMVIMTAGATQSKCCKVHVRGSFSLLLYSLLGFQNAFIFRKLTAKMYSSFGSQWKQLHLQNSFHNIMSNAYMYNDHFPTTTWRVHIYKKKNENLELRTEIKTDWQLLDLCLMALLWCCVRSISHSVCYTSRVICMKELLSIVKNPLQKYHLLAI